MSSSPINSPRLILLPNTDDRDPLEDYATDEDEDEDDNEHNGPQPGINHPPLPPLPPSVVFLYLLSPYLRLGAIYASDIDDASLIYGLTALFVAAVLSAFCRHLWFLLGRYMRKPSTEDILVHMFPRGHRGARRRGLARSIFTIISGSFRLLLAAMYLRGRFRLYDYGASFLILLITRFCGLCAPPSTPKINSITLPPQYFNTSIYSGICTIHP